MKVMLKFNAKILKLRKKYFTRNETCQSCTQGLDKYCPASKFQWKMPDNAGTANTPKITEVANTGTYENFFVETSEKLRFFDVLHVGPHDSKFPHF